MNEKTSPQAGAIDYASEQLSWKLEEETPKHKIFFAAVDVFFLAKINFVSPTNIPIMEHAKQLLEGQALEIFMEGLEVFGEISSRSLHTLFNLNLGIIADQACMDKWQKNVQEKYPEFVLDQSKKWYKVNTT